MPLRDPLPAILKYHWSRWTLAAWVFLEAYDKSSSLLAKNGRISGACLLRRASTGAI
ncbi:hypothetical protein ACPOL_0195 [Acidisarcina polymorpha]|uniref:Uncharacterized protein n=1 Tax=Acidisarcina polymorpha TaxID=2211140 RepID=A0A2Z5FS54_9BACT|nr:hypothetical protein ACPOL_0195 [Acidisarcina polymorpha]